MLQDEPVSFFFSELHLLLLFSPHAAAREEPTH
jgi:hypothetical protein